MDHTHHHVAAVADGPAVVISAAPVAHHTAAANARRPRDCGAGHLLLLCHGEAAGFRLLGSLSLRIQLTLAPALRPVATVLCRAPGPRRGR
ncbi:hypothetical protein QJS66_17730 [Kocuria rhizophila]|nr:hypothetical protein QJS66_17730 [Kocuria rhizophila]